MSFETTKFNHYFALIVAIFFVSSPLYAGAIYNCDSTQSGDWDQASTWVNCNGSFPDNISEDFVTIKDGHTVNFNLPFVEINRFTMEANSQLIISSGVPGRTIIVGNEAFSAGNGSIVLASDLTINADNENILFGFIDGNHNLIANSSGLTRFSRAIGNNTPLLSITTDAPGTTNLTQTYSIELNGNTATSFNDNITVGASGRITINHSGVGDVIFNGTINNISGSPHQLFVNTVNSLIYFNGDVNLGQLVTGGFGITMVNANMQTNSGGANNGNLIFDNQVMIMGDYTFTTTGGGDLFFNNGMDDDNNGATPSNIILDSPNDITINRVGGFFPLDGLATVNTGALIVNADVDTLGIQLYQPAVVQTTDVAFTSLNDSATFIAGLDAASFNTQLNFGSDFDPSTANISGVDTLTLGPLGKTLFPTLFDYDVPFNLVFLNPIELENSSALLSAKTVQMTADVSLGTANGLDLTTTEGSSTISGNISGVGGAIFKSGNGSLSIDGNINIDGLVEALGGTLLINGGGSSYTAEAKNNAIIGGSGAIVGMLTVSDSATVSPGPTDGVGLLDVDGLSIGSNGNFEVTINGIDAGSGYDQISSTTDVNVGGNLLLTGNYSVETGDTFTLIENMSANPISGTFNGLAEGDMVNPALQISYIGGDGNDVVLTGVCDQTVTVTNNADSGAGSLRQAIADVCDQGMVNFDNNYTITFLSEITIDKEVLIDGNSQTFDGNTTTALFNIDANGSLSINQINMINANSGFGAIYNVGTLNLDETYFANNSSTGSGGLGGGAVINTDFGVAMITRSVFYQNNAFRGGALFNDGNATMTVVNSTLHENGNLDSTEGGAIQNRGLMTLQNTTITDSGDGDTPVGNSIFQFSNLAVLNLNNTVISSAASNNECNIAANSVIITTNSFVDDGSCDATFSGDALLGTWADLGGYANSILPLENSPLINTGDDASCPAEDPIGTVRPQGLHCDIGAMELVDTTFPEVTTVLTNGEVLNACDASNTDVTEIQVTFSERVLDADIPANYQLRHAGANQSFDFGGPPAAKSGFGGDDYFIDIIAAVSDNHDSTPTITLTLDQAIPDGILLLTVYSDITDEFFNDLNDGSDYEHPFRLDIGNLFKGGHFDVCGPFLSFFDWQVGGGLVRPGTDADNSNASYSLEKNIDSMNSFALSQCVDMDSTLPVYIDAYFKESFAGPIFKSNEKGSNGSFEIEMSCQQFDSTQCMGNTLDELLVTTSAFSTDDLWIQVKEQIGYLNSSTQSAQCGIRVIPNQSDQYDFFIDKARLTIEDLIFEDGFDPEELLQACLSTDKGCF